jgi:hypothetical protein
MTEPGQASLESLTPARRAVLVLLVSQNRSYADLAALLATNPDAIRERAIEAADELLSDALSAPVPEVRERLVDYALGQQRVTERQHTREMLADSPVARAWVESLERAIGIRGGDPAGGHPAAAPETVPPPSLDLTAPPEPAPAESAPRRGSSSSRAYLAVGAVAVVLGLVLLIIGGGGGGGGGAGARRSSTGAAAGVNAAPRLLVQIVLSPAGSAPRATGTAQIVRRGPRLLLALRIAGVRGTTGERYAAWLEGRQGPRLLGFVSRSQSAGGLTGAAVLPVDVGTFTTLAVTREFSSSPAEPGPSVLRAPLPRPL